MPFREIFLFCFEVALNNIFLYFYGCLPICETTSLSNGRTHPGVLIIVLGFFGEAYFCLDNNGVLLSCN